MRQIIPSDNHLTIRNLNYWRNGISMGGFFYERHSYWCCGANWCLWSWALPLYFELTRVWGCATVKPWGFQRLGLTVRILCISLSITLWNRE